ncbi:hypothetical protein P7K49_037766 [Saguinus oedipus]|uniref:Uncharacterized protein n=1 Tax=Saguinus oedipus TaxID=9490 RepID=A0ABQ9TJ30_SAGOE|nr:hypothetical protein P7K49_037766 [Saguinus oedipus]
MAEAYSEIGMKGENQRRRGKGHDGLYQVGAAGRPFRGRGTTIKAPTLCQLLPAAGQGKPRTTIHASGNATANKSLEHSWDSAIQSNYLVPTMQFGHGRHSSSCPEVCSPPAGAGEGKGPHE